MSDGHEWCRDVRRDEQVRAAEDAAAVPAIQHRDLPEVVADLRDRVARLEAAQATIGSGDVCADVQCGSTADEIARLTAERDAARARVEELERAYSAECDARAQAHRELAELEAAPPPRGWLTAEEREAVECCARTCEDERNPGAHNVAVALRDLLARETPPEVVLPGTQVRYHRLSVEEQRDDQWLAALAAAGVKVVEVEG